MRANLLLKWKYSRQYPSSIIFCAVSLLSIVSLSEQLSIDWFQQWKNHSWILIAIEISKGCKNLLKPYQFKRLSRLKISISLSLSMLAWRKFILILHEKILHENRIQFLSFALSSIEWIASKPSIDKVCVSFLRKLFFFSLNAEIRIYRLWDGATNEEKYDWHFSGWCFRFRVRLMCLFSVLLIAIAFTHFCGSRFSSSNPIDVEMIFCGCRATQSSSVNTPYVACTQFFFLF